MIADLHIHSKYSRATSPRMDLREIAHYAPMKGLDLVGTGDFTHESWVEEIRNSVEWDEDTKTFGVRGGDVRFILSSEVDTTFAFGGKTKRIHHVILADSLDSVEGIRERLSRFGDLNVDGRPTLRVEPPELVEEVLSVSSHCEVFPAHAWTPWFSVFGANSGFDRLEDCYQDQLKNIHCVETGLSSDPPMNWRLSSLDSYLLVSNSDSHSAWPWRLGREANVMDLSRISYDEIIRAIRNHDVYRFRMTIETYPAYGKYHWTGHRKCGVNVSPEESLRLGGVCPVCGRRMTLGVDERVEILADRERGYRPPGAPGYVHLLPLHEIISVVMGSTVSSSRTWDRYMKLITAFGDEYTVLLEPDLHRLSEYVEPEIAEAIVDVREGRVNVQPGFDGVYGEMAFGEDRHSKDRGHLEDFM